MPSLFVGVDVGGTRTRAVVSGSDLVVLGRGASGAANASQTPVPRVVQAIAEAIEDALAAAAVRPRDVSAIACGIAGVEAAAQEGRLTAALESTFSGRPVLVTTDARIALAGSVGDPVHGAGAVLIAGTGAVAFGRNRHGLEERVGGWGAVIGDEGSGAEIGRRCLAAIARDVDGRGPRTAMREALHASEGTRSAAGTLQRLVQPGASPADIAAYVPLVIDAAHAGDPVARGILDWAAEELARTTITLLRKLGLADEAIPVATVGGVFSAGELILGTLRERILGVAPKVHLGPPPFPPELGAVRLAVARWGDLDG